MKTRSEIPSSANRESKSVAENPGQTGCVAIEVESLSHCSRGKMPLEPAGWKPPLHSETSSKPSRREFAKLLGCAVLAGAGLAATRPLAGIREARLAEPKSVAMADEIPVGGSRLFRYPTDHDPCILVRLADDQYAAYSQSCTHLMCPVYYQPEKQQFVCPCHEGFFSALDGAVLAGPPRRPLPSYAVEIRERQILVGPQKSDRA